VSSTKTHLSSTKGHVGSTETHLSSTKPRRRTKQNTKNNRFFC